MYRIELTDLYYKPLLEILDASDRSLTLNLNRTYDTFSFKVRMDNEASEVLSDGNGYIKVYRNSTLEFFGYIISAEEEGSDTTATLSVNCASFGWNLSNKYMTVDYWENAVRTHAVIASSLIGEWKLDRSVPGTITERPNRERIMPIMPHGDGDEYGSQLASVGMVDYIGNVTSSPSTISNYKSERLVNVGEEIARLSAGSTGFDYRIVPVENWDYTTGSLVGRGYPALFLARELIGTSRPNAVFEWGIGQHNMKSYKRSTTRDQQALTTYGDMPFESVDGFKLLQEDSTPPVGMTVSQFKDVWHWPQAVVSVDISDETMYRSLLKEHAEARKFLKKTITFEPHIDPQAVGFLPQYGIDYLLGDSIRGRAYVRTTNSMRFDGMFRVWGVTLTVDANGVETTSIVVEDPT